MRTYTLLMTALLACLGACYGDLQGLTVPPEVAASSEAEPYFADGGYMLDKSKVAVIRRIDMQGLGEDGVVVGFDLDGQTSEEGDSASCGHGDFVDDAGREGVDNQFAELWTAIELLVGEQVEALLLNAINDGRFLLLIELTGVDDLKNDDDVTVTVLRGEANPLVSSLGWLMSDQTYAIDPDYPISVLENVPLVDGVLEAGPLTFNIPIEIFDADFLFALEQGRLRVQVHDDGSFSGVIGGKMHVQDALDKLYTTNAAAEAELVTDYFLEHADMDRQDGTCVYMSAGVSFEAASAFLVRYPEDQVD